MHNALDNDELEMHYQPVFCCRTGRPVAEEIGFIGELGKFQFDVVLSWFPKTRNQLRDDFRVALNLSPTQLQDPKFKEWLLEALATSKLPMNSIELEITETALLEDTPETQTNVRALANLGGCITLDDFGTGQSSLSVLKQFPIGRLKIDQSFVRGLPDRTDDIAIVNAVLSLAHSLDIPVDGEGVEEEEQKQYLIDH